MWISFHDEKYFSSRQKIFFFTTKNIFFHENNFSKQMFSLTIKTL